jgi:FAD/FMN-containing dehydrogenase
MVLEDIHGAGTRVPVSATACAMRVAGFNLVIVSQWSDPRDTEACTAWARQTYETLRSYFAPTRYVNYLEVDAEGDPAAAVYGPNYPRLRELKRQYDPDNVFHQNVNIRPA